jgi:putative component of toxin-antitoxin plasmid stabilization module
MKKILVTLVFGCVSIAGFSNSGNPEFAYDSLRKIEAKYINVRALKDFKSSFSGDATWFTSNKGSISYFTQDGYTNRVYYDKKGHWIYSLLSYGEAKLDRGVRKAVMMNYYDQSITLVRELQTLSGLVYVITLEDKSSIKILKINKEGEMEIMQEMRKQ